MIVVAIIGILAAIAIPAYNSYIATAKMSKVQDHADNARRTVSNMFKKDVARRAMNLTTGLAPTSISGIVSQLNNESSGATAPEKGLAPYSTSASGITNGQVILSGSGPTNSGDWQNGDTVDIDFGNDGTNQYLDMTIGHYTVTYD